ncbi:hypothetical protein M0R45_037896 [Rubus argutus]|uniref:Uncharacterized protein n=1 Tax=Rubus argutus TaxID=59490 RepID=A0AAW1W1M3_RUBAR
MNSLFDVFCECAELNPEPIEENEEEEHNWIFSAEQMEDEGAARTVLELEIHEQRFEDAEEVEHETDSAECLVFYPINIASSKL